MRAFKRGVEPDFLASNSARWGHQWENLKARNRGAKFPWRVVAGQPTNRRLLPLLRAQTQEHCSFCDAHPMHPPSRETIEHFQPKSSFPRAAYDWRNLYYCCDCCQGAKGDQFEDSLLRPDADGFCFENFFYWDHTNGLLKVNPQASPQDQNRAKVTIEIFGLNEGHPQRRLREAQIRSRCCDMDIDVFAYRGFLEEKSLQVI